MSGVRSTRVTATEVGADIREGRVYFCLDERALIDDAGHYLIYGSEYLCSIAACLCRIITARDGWAQDYRDVLKRRGTPTVFVCDVPVVVLPSFTPGEMAEALLEGLAAVQGTVDADLLTAPRDASGFWTDRCVPSACIAGYTHPPRIRDWPTLGGGYYRWGVLGRQ